MKSTGDVSVSGGYSTSDGALAEVSISERNFLGRGLYAKAAVTYGQYARGYNLSFVDPYLLDYRVALGLDLVRTPSTGGHGAGEDWVWLLHDDCAPEPRALEHLLDVGTASVQVGVVGPKLVGWDDFESVRAAARAQGRRVGIGLACYVEGTGVGPYEGGHVVVETSGKVKVAVAREAASIGSAKLTKT